MEGVLLKWTNYYNGWQPRYFILNETGILSYYKSRELIHEGCKGSCRVSACEVKAHPHDPLRIDIAIPCEQLFCLRAKSQPDRQKWLVALGSCKAIGNKSTNNTNTSTALVSSTATSLHSISVSDHELQLKIHELRLYSDLLMQRVHTVKSVANDTPVPDVKKLDESTSMLSATCDAFIHTLDECVKLATGGSGEGSLLSPSSPTSGTSCFNLPSSPSFNVSNDSQRRSTDDGNSSLTTTTVIKPIKNDAIKQTIPAPIVYRSFFSELRYKFSELSSGPFTDLKTELFLLTCESYFTLIDKFNSPTFIPLKADVNGNISKLRRKMSTDSAKFQTLKSIIDDEIQAQTTKERNSATDALLWLKRGLHFLCCFLHEFGLGDKSVEDAINKAYSQSLKRYHGWITRGIFSVALRSVPYTEDFLKSLVIDQEDLAEVLFEQQILDEMTDHSWHMDNVLKKINDYYFQSGLESSEIVG